MQAPPPEGNLPSQERQILLSLSRMGAIGNKVVSLRDLRKGLPDEVKLNYSAYLKSLQGKLFIEISQGSGDGVVRITPLGLAFIRQIQEDEFRLITGGRTNV